jgi:uncharacterized protein (DUF2141 family)
MSAYIFVMEHSFFAVTDEAGSYTIPELPPGKYTLGVWHEAFGSKEMEIEVGGSPTTDADAVLSGT